MKYLVNIKEVLTRDIIIEAENETDAENRVKQLYCDEKIVLDADDFIGEPTITCIHNCDETEKETTED